MTERFVGIDVGAETIRIVELQRQDGGALRWERRVLAEHHKAPAKVLMRLLSDWDWDGVTAAAVTGRLGRMVQLQRVPPKQAQVRGFRWRFGDDDATVVSIGSHGFSVLELRSSGLEVFRENSRCSQGTGNFLRQLVERFDLSIEEASALCEEVGDPAPLSGRCPVILKTDMTHLANKGESRARILAGLYDAVCENVQVLIKPRVSPERVLLIGGVTRSQRVRRRFAELLSRHDMHLLPAPVEDALHLEALGAAAVAAESATGAPALTDLLAPPEALSLDQVPALSGFLSNVVRMTMPPQPDPGDAPRALILGFDIGSTGSKVVALDADSGGLAWEGYVRTNGNPVGAAQALMRKFSDGPQGHHRVVACSATGSGREIVGSLLSSCYGVERVYVLNEIAAHAEGALHFDPRVDTIFEIGGQDAKYIRLSDGRVVDAAMNEACSAGTGSFIEEQGKRFAGIRDVVHLGEEALCASAGVSLGQHCSVFMAEVIDEAVAASVDSGAIIAGIYDSIVQNYLNRVKGSRSVGQVVFCQGMPFASDALAAAVARQTGSRVIVPPNPGTVGALGIALLARKAIPDVAGLEGLAPSLFLAAELDGKDEFVCKATKGCGGAGNRCRIDRIAVRVSERKHRFTWGGSCSLWDRGTGKRKLPDQTPDPFREREELFAKLRRQRAPRGDRPSLALTDAFQLKGLAPFFLTFLDELGFDVTVAAGADHKALKRGIEEANIPYCAPMQLHHGLVSAMAELPVDRLFLPMIRSLPRSGDEPNSVTCPIVQGSPDLLRWDLGAQDAGRIVSPVFDFGADGFDSAEFLRSCVAAAAELGVVGPRAWRAFRRGADAQRRFQEECLAAGERALEFCKGNDVVPVVVLGRPYTIYNKVLNSNVPALLREQGAVAIPVDCYPVDKEVPTFHGVYWTHGQRSLRAAHQIRRADGVYGLWASNYSCGPDSFNLHFFAYAMEGKPFAIIETDGHAGDAGTKTRVEAFLHCVYEDLSDRHAARPMHDFSTVQRSTHGLPDMLRERETILIPRMGPGAEALAACLRGVGHDVECLPMPDRAALALGRRHTSGKECVPMCVTAGSLLQRLEHEPDPSRRFAFFMPTANGPCRFGVYNILQRIILERVGEGHRVNLWSPVDSDYFEGVPPGFAALVFTGFAAHDMLEAALLDIRPVARDRDAVQATYDRYIGELLGLLERAAAGDLSVRATLVQVASGRLFGTADLLRRAGRELSGMRSGRAVPTVMVVGEIYVRCDPFANDFVIDKLEARGLRVRFAPFSEWLEYSDYLSLNKGERSGLGAHFSSFVQKRIQQRAYDSVGDALGWPRRTSVTDSIGAAAPYVREALTGEAVLTVGGPVHEHREGLIDGVVSVGPHECMPNKIAEAQFFHVAEREQLASLTVPLNGEPINPEVLDCFAFEVLERFRARQSDRRTAAEPSSVVRLRV